MASPRTSEPSNRASGLVFEMVSILHEPRPALLDKPGPILADRDTEVDPPRRPLPPFEVDRPSSRPTRRMGDRRVTR